MADNQESYTGKGKGKAVDQDLDIDLGSLSFPSEVETTSAIFPAAFSVPTQPLATKPIFPREPTATTTGTTTGTSTAHPVPPIRPLSPVHPAPMPPIRPLSPVHPAPIPTIRPLNPASQPWNPPSQAWNSYPPTGIYQAGQNPYHAGMVPHGRLDKGKGKEREVFPPYSYIEYPSPFQSFEEVQVRRSQSGGVLGYTFDYGEQQVFSADKMWVETRQQGTVFLVNTGWPVFIKLGRGG
ncbi:hypothetical protein A1O3_06087 [Capronia epimyces CBS 606.96]|uniref:Uncharacterized protein n=1 Tax=Capronia epimyces CBS 606.96 TaxID=1182542 RepID=W9YJ01_9EURO|nr:uncharacterized protein A1O3_06087 [Capronia epimyces CBS 606.96]EXJ82274.1 hypothetical protein A1O3_06087 [Capronia epimyces CBS 606.96]